jgi:xylose dehydrogenase (NAD/NADP)
MDFTDPFDSVPERDWQTVEEGGPVRFAVVGLGWWTRDEALPALEAAELCDPTVTVSSTTEKAHQVAEVYPTVEHAISYEAFHDGHAQTAYDAVYIATPNAKHLEYAETAAALGKAVLCEKPIEATVERAEALVEAASDIHLAVEYRMHVQPAVRMMRELVADGFIGDVAHVHGNMSQRLMEINPDPDQWRLNPDLAGAGGSVTDLGVYSINTTRYVLGEDPLAVSGATWSGTEAFTSIPDERAAFTVEFPDGVLASCSASQNAYRASNLRVIGTDGELLLEDAFLGGERELTVTRGETTITTGFGQIRETRRSLEHFGDHILTGTPVERDGHHGLVDQRAIDAVYEAAEQGERVEL